MGKQYLFFDFETFSEADIRKTGAFEYAVHSSTEILCVAYRLGTLEDIRSKKTQLISFYDWENKSIDTEFIRAILNPHVMLVAHNALFERVVVEHVLSRTANLIGSALASKTDPTRWLCTASMARSAGLPGSLDGASSALNLAHKKDKVGYALMLKVCKPRKASEANPNLRHLDREDMLRLFKYCKSDVDAEVDLYFALPKLNQCERAFWLLDQKINLRGFAVDRKLVKGALACIKRHTTTLDAKMQALTGGTVDSARQRDATLKFLDGEGLKLPDLKSGTVDKALKNPDIDENLKMVLSLRQSVSKSSTAKFKAFEIRSRFDGRARDNTIFYGAHTGRQSGTGLQPQNLFKSVIAKDDIETAIELIKNKDLTAIEALFDSPMNVFASVLRGAIVAPQDSVLDVGDFATVEVRVLFWLAGHQKGLDDLAAGKDLYLAMASVIYALDLEELTRSYKAGEANPMLRQLGKQVVIGAGFGIGIGGHKFQATTAQYGMDISLSLAQKSIRAYRSIHAPIPRFWASLEHAATQAVLNKGKSFKVGRLVWKYEGRWLTCELPIGRLLRYFKPKMQWENKSGISSMVLTYMGVDSVSRKFKRMSTWGGKLTENVVQAVSRDLLYDSLFRLETFGHAPVLAIHDEIVCERLVSGPNYQPEPIELFMGYEDNEMLEVMEETSDWADGLPMKVEGWSDTRYRK